MERWPEIEAMLESAGRRDKMEADVSRYIEDLRDFEKQNGNVRLWGVLIIAVSILIG